MSSENNVQQITGSAKMVTITPVFQVFQPYGILNSQRITTITDTGGTVTSDTSNGVEISLDITTSSGSFATLRSARVLKYRPGLSNSIRFGMTFATPVANSLQYGGLSNEGSQISFAYVGTDFVIRKLTDGHLEVRTLTITAAETGAATATVTLDSVAFAVTLSNAGGALSFTAHELEIFTYAGWDVEHVNDTITFVSNDIIAGPLTGTFSYSSTGASTGTFARTKAGVVVTETTVSQADWNSNSEMITLLDPTLFNTYEIEYSWLGGGNIDFRVLNPRDGKYETVHSIQTANTGVGVSLSQPNMYGEVSLSSVGSTTAMTVSVSGLMGGTYGPVHVKTPIYAISNERTIAANTETVVLVVHDRHSINGYVNQSEILINHLSGAADGNRAVLIKMIKNPTTLSANTTGDYANNQYVNELESISIVDTESLTYTGGNIIDEFFIGKNGNLDVTYDSDRQIELFQSEAIILTAFSTATNTVNLSMSLLEDH
ncbi:MAG: hypothetical protein N2B06_01790 [Clostridium sp.]